MERFCLFMYLEYVVLWTGSNDGTGRSAVQVQLGIFYRQVKEKQLRLNPYILSYLRSYISDAM